MFPRLLVAAFFALPASAQQFVLNTADVPPSAGTTEQVDYADVDLDGDWDVGFANGGDIGNQQNILWINRGGLQGGVVGVFTNETVTRFPAILDASRDIEFADYDSDGDPDAFIANDCALSNQPSRFWTNRGGAQGGTIGTYVDETSTRWIGLGGAGSSMPTSQVLAGGGYIEFPNDTDFADFDNDGDLDLIHATWGPAAIGQAPTRIFQNDGAGFFTEFNPSGFQLSGGNILNGNPGLWCQGTQMANTTNATGVNCDIATSAINADWGDVDGDLDLDILLGARQEFPRLFLNRLEENGGVPGFRDATGASFQAGYSQGSGHYEETFGDFDGDDDIDIYGVNWLTTFSLVDVALRNSGAGFFNQLISIPASLPDDSNAELIDYDLDGDVDVFVSCFGGQERIVRNDGGWAFSATTGLMTPDGTTTQDSEVADADNDGDYDVINANDAGQAEWYLKNTATANDVTAPRIVRLEQAPFRQPGLNPTVVRCQVYDNAPLNLSQWLVPVVEVRVDSGPTTSIPMRSSFGQIFRGAISGALVGLIEYRVTIADEHGNTSATPWLLYVSGVSGTPFCSGDGTGTQCPCGNNASAGRGCGNSLGAGARLTGSGTPLVSSDSFVLSVSPVPNSSVLFFQGTAQVSGGAGSVFGDGLRCAGGTVTRLGTRTAVANYAQYPDVLDAPVSIRAAIPLAGGNRTYQAWYRNAAAFCTPSTFNLSNGWEVLWLP
ncbi:MAG: VCBS repeat-containing protein [Planctomycetota bacterium]|nr:VCBS repeat-containing protein [Planctomycetota bacterium]